MREPPAKARPADRGSRRDHRDSTEDAEKKGQGENLQDRKSLRAPAGLG